MRNLLLSSLVLSRTRFAATEEDEENGEQNKTRPCFAPRGGKISCAPARDEENGLAMVCFDDGRMVRARCDATTSEEARETKSFLLKDTEEVEDQDQETNERQKRNAVSVERLPDLRATFVALECGELLLVNDGSSSSSSSSPLDIEKARGGRPADASRQVLADGQMCAVLTKSGKILIMNGDFYLLNERKSCLDDVDEDNEDDEEEEMIKSGNITWRNDGESFCVYCTTSKDGKNHLRTYSRDKLEILGRGDVEHDNDETGPGKMCENAAIAWQPRGALIAVSGVAVVVIVAVVVVVVVTGKGKTTTKKLGSHASYFTRKMAYGDLRYSCVGFKVRQLRISAGP